MLISSSIFFVHFSSDFNEIWILAEEACMVWCLKRNGDTKNRGWTFPDGTVCQTRRTRFGKQAYCINGRCEVYFVNIPMMMKEIYVGKFVGI